MLWQRTLKTQIEASGVGLHSGQRVRMVLRPAAANTGIRFRRLDLDPGEAILAEPAAVGDTRMCSCLERQTAKGPIKISTIEHLMSALCAAGIDNLEVDLDGEEVPILDGSASPFWFLLRSAGIREQQVAKRFIRVEAPVRVCDGDKWAMLEPHDGLSFCFSISFEHPAIGRTDQTSRFEFGRQSYADAIARARTFGFTQEVEWMRQNGLARGGGLENAIVLDEYRILNEDGLRYRDEFVRHKILDAIGDLYVLGSPLIAAFSAYKSGHALNNTLARALLANRESWRYVDFADAAPSPTLDLWLGAASPVMAT